MNWQEYKALAIRTESVPANIFGRATNNRTATRLLHAALGVCTEVAELHDGHTVVNKLEELGDILWYLAIADDVLDWHSEHYHADMMKPALFYIGEIQDVVKRHIFYGKSLDVERISRSFSAILEHVMADLKMSGLPLEDCCRANIMKLEKRYPEKFFDAKAAIHRDVDRELEHISETGKVLTGEVEIKPFTLELGGTPMDKDTIMETFFPINQVLLSFQGFNDLVRSVLTLGQIEQMAMDLAFTRAEQYRKMGALELARGYDAMYRSYSGKGDRLEDFSVAIMWQEAGYSMDEGKVKELLERWK